MAEKGDHSERPRRKARPAAPTAKELDLSVPAPLVRGRVPATVDETTLYRLAKIHCSVHEMSLILGCSHDILADRYMHIIDRGRAEGKEGLRRMQWRLAEEGNAAMGIWLGKQYLDQRERQPDEVTQIHFHVAIKEIPK